MLSIQIQGLHPCMSKRPQSLQRLDQLKQTQKAIAIVVLYLLLVLDVAALALFRIHTTARELPMKRMAIQLTITSNLPWPVTLTALTLTPQHGLRIDTAPGCSSLLYPLMLNPASTASAVLFVSTKTGGRSASRGNLLRGAGQGTTNAPSLLCPVRCLRGVGNLHC